MSVERCKGYADALGVPLGDQMIDSGIDPTSVYNKVKSYLSQHPDTQAILTLGPNSADPTIKLLRDMGQTNKYNFISFDLSSDIAQGIKDGIVSAAIDQQPFLQGYMPVSLLTRLCPIRRDPGEQHQHRPGLCDQGQYKLVENWPASIADRLGPSANGPESAATLLRRSVRPDRY